MKKQQADDKLAGLQSLDVELGLLSQSTSQSRPSGVTVLRPLHGTLQGQHQITTLNSLPAGYQDTQARAHSSLVISDVSAAAMPCGPGGSDNAGGGRATLRNDAMHPVESIPSYVAPPPRAILRAHTRPVVLENMPLRLGKGVGDLRSVTEWLQKEQDRTTAQMNEERNVWAREV